MTLTISEQVTIVAFVLVFLVLLVRFADSSDCINRQLQWWSCASLPNINPGNWSHRFMAPRINNVFARTALGCGLLICFAGNSQAQKSYSTSRYRGQQLLEERQVYDTNSQQNFESKGGFQAMSPDRWSLPPLGSRPTVVNQPEESKSRTAPKLTNKFKVPAKFRDAELKAPSSKPAASYWSQAGIDIPLKPEGRGSAERNPLPNSEYPLPVSKVQKTLEPIKSLSLAMPFVGSPNRVNELNRVNEVDLEQGRQEQVQVFDSQHSVSSGSGSRLSGSFPLDLGFRRSEITKRPSVDFSPPAAYPAAECDGGKSNSPGLEEIIRTGRFLSSANVSFLKPVLQGDVAFNTSGSAGQIHENFEYDYNSASQFSLGFESQAGPGINVSYWEFDGASETASWTNPDVNNNLQTIDFGGLLGGRQISTRGEGDTVTVTDALDIQRIEASFYKDIKFKVSRMSGRFGFQWIEINRQTNALYAETFFAGGETITWAGADQFQGAGPTFGFDYFRPIGHTKIEFLASGDCGLSFGHRDKVVNVVVNETPDVVFQNGGDDEFLTNLNLFMGVQYVISRGGNRCFYLRSGLDYQAWLGADNTTASNSDFGLRGFSLTLGYNR